MRPWLGGRRSREGGSRGGAHGGEGPGMPPLRPPRWPLPLPAAALPAAALQAAASPFSLAFVAVHQSAQHVPHIVLAGLGRVFKIWDLGTEAFVASSIQLQPRNALSLHQSPSCKKRHHNTHHTCTALCRSSRFDETDVLD